MFGIAASKNATFEMKLSWPLFQIESDREFVPPGVAFGDDGALGTPDPFLEPSWPILATNGTSSLNPLAESFTSLQKEGASRRSCLARYLLHFCPQH